MPQAGAEGMNQLIPQENSSLFQGIKVLVVDDEFYSRKVARTTADPCTPCPVCGGLECLCRPRFYAGQLLNEQDLNRLDRYIVAKNRLHNRYLHGWGGLGATRRIVTTG